MALSIGSIKKLLKKQVLIEFTWQGESIGIGSDLLKEVLKKS